MSKTLECTEKVVSDLLAEIAQLKSENEVLIVDNMILHNRITNQNEILSAHVYVNIDPGMQNKYEQELADVDFDAYAEAFDDISLNRI
jgi:regulator of replication initiation timing